MTRSPEVAVVIVSYNTRDDTVACVRSLLAETAAPLEVVVVDNASHDGSAAALRAAFPAATVVDAGANLGFARAVNLAVAEHVTAPRVLLLNPDTTVLPGAVDAILASAHARPGNRLYGGRTLRPDGTTDPSSCWGAMTLWSLTCFALGLSTAFKRSRVFDPESLGRWERDTVREVPVVTGCLLLVSRADWTALGGMDERFFLYGEDADFSRRAIAHGMRPVVVPEAVIVHAVGGSTGSGGRKMCMVMAGKATYLRTHWSRPASAVGIALLQAGAGARAAVSRVARRGGGSWHEVWRRRRDWREGYPAATSRIFGIDAAAPRPTAHANGPA